MKYLRYIVLFELYLIVTALTTIIGFYLNIPLFSGMGFIYTLYPFKFYVGTQVISVHFFSIYIFIQMLPLIYIGFVFVLSNSNYLMRKLNLVGIFMIAVGLISIISTLVDMIMSTIAPTQANYEQAQSLANYFQLSSMVFLLVMILVLLFIRVQTKSQRFYKWFLIIYPGLMFVVAYQAFTFVLIAFGLAGGVSQDVFMQYNAVFTAINSLISCVLYLIFLFALRNIDAPETELTTIKELSYPTATSHV